MSSCLGRAEDVEILDQAVPHGDVVEVVFDAERLVQVVALHPEHVAAVDGELALDQQIAGDLIARRTRIDEDLAVRVDELDPAERGAGDDREDLVPVRGDRPCWFR